MSASIIESKFQALDRATKLLAAARHRGTKVSSQQLRDLVERERHQTTAGGGKGSTSSACQSAPARPSSQKKESRRVREPALSHIASSAKAPMAPETMPEDGGDVDERRADFVGTAARRTSELQCRTWDEIEAAVAGVKLIAMQGRSRRDGNDALHRAQQASRSSTDRSAETPPIEPSRKHPTPISPSGASPARGKVTQRSGVVRCRSASRTSRTIGGTKAASSARNWFVAPKTRPETGPSTRKPCDQHHRTRRHHDCGDIRHDDESGGDLACIEGAEQSDTTEGLNASGINVIDQPSFYYLELRLDHPEPLATWRFQATFTDLTAAATPPVTLDYLTVDDDNGLLFAVPGQNNSTSRFFNPVVHFRGVIRPRDLYDHVIKVLVRATQPVERVVIDSLVHFSLSPSEDQPSPQDANPPSPPRPSDPFLLVSIDSDQPPTPPRASDVSPVPSSLPNSPPSRRARATRRPSVPRRRRPSSPADDRSWSPWDGPVDATGVVIRHSPLKSPPTAAPPRERSPSPVFRDELVGQAPPTTDRKKMQLRQLRADVRRRMLQEALQSSSINGVPMSR